MTSFPSLLRFGLDEYLLYVLIYGLTAVPLFLLLWRYGRVRFATWRIQTRRRASRQHLANEVKNSLGAFGVFVLIDGLLLLAQQNGYTTIYERVADYGWGYLLLSVLVMLVLHDTYFYWSHRLMHHPRLFRLVHKVHHQSTDPSPLAAYSFHPAEAVIEAGVYVLFSFLLPDHLFALFGFQLVSTLLNVIGHAGYEIYPSRMLQNRFWNWIAPSTHHNMYHAKFNGNYGLYFTFWDRWMKTEFRDYPKTLAEVVRRRDRRSAKPLTIALLLSLPATGWSQPSIAGTWRSADREGRIQITVCMTPPRQKPMPVSCGSKTTGP